MEFDILELKKESNKKKWKKNIEELNLKYEEYYDKFKNFIKEENEENIEGENNKEPTIGEIYKKGKKILDADDKILGELIDIVTVDGRTCIVIKENLKNQGEKIESINPELKEMNFSLKRAGNKIKDMIKQQLKDTYIKCLISVIGIIIITIIITSLCKGKKNNNYNLPFDIFSSNNKGNNNSTSYNCYLGLFNNYYYLIIFIILFI